MIPETGGAQEAYPTRSVQIIVPFPPGGVADLTTRPLAANLEKVLKQPVVVVNKGGAGGAVGVQSAAVSKPDGYTLLSTLNNMSVTPEVDDLFGRRLAMTSRSTSTLRRRHRRQVPRTKTRYKSFEIIPEAVAYHRIYGIDNRQVFHENIDDLS